MLGLRAQSLGVFTKPPRTIQLAQMVPFGEHRAPRALEDCEAAC